MKTIKTIALAMVAMAFTVAAYAVHHLKPRNVTAAKALTNALFYVAEPWLTAKARRPLGR